MKISPLLASALLMGTAFAEKPNIVHIIADDLGWNDVGFHHSDIKTPRLDALAAESTELHRFYVAPICSPTRAGVLTGRYPFRFGIFDGVCAPDERYGLPPAEKTIPEMLAGAGYANRALMGKWHLGLASTVFHPLNHGFSTFYGHYNGAIDYFSHERAGTLDWHQDFEPLHEKGYSTDLVGGHAASFIKQHASDGPFHLMVTFNAPHSPLQAKPEDLDRYGFDPDGPRLPNKDAALARKENAPDYGKGGKGNTVRQTFAAMTTGMDRNIGQILDAIKEAGIEDKTLVIFHSDNGGTPPQGGDNKPLRGAKFSTWEGGVRVVALIRWPGRIEGGRRFEQPLAYIDLLPTLAGIAGQPLPPGVDGVDFLPALTKLAAFPERAILLGKDTVLRGDWKLKGSELFDLAKDPGEKNSIAAAHPEVVTRLRADLSRFKEIEGPRYTSSLPAPQPWPPKEWKLPAENPQ